MKSAPARPATPRHRAPTVAIVGRPNVGKSSLLNALVGKRISIVQDMPGVTRDRIATYLPIGDRFVELVDTGGYGHVDVDNLTEHINHQIELAMAKADLVLFVVDCSAGLTSADNTIAALLRKKNIKTLLIANKADGASADLALGDFARLGLGTPLGVSAMNGRNVSDITDRVSATIDLSNAPTEIPDPEMLVAIVGKRNAGKSTLVNAIAHLYEGDGDRVIVSEVPGTTRDSVDVRFEKDGKSLIVIDTAGVRKKRHMVNNDIEFYSFHRAERSIRRAGVVLLLIDATQPVSEPDKKLAQYVHDQFKPVVIVINKWDLAKEQLRANRKDGDQLRDEDIMEEFRKYLDAELRRLDYAPIAFVTAKDGKNVQVVVDLAQHLFRQSLERVTTGRLNTAIRAIMTERPPSTPSGRRARIYYATQTDVAPPTLVLFVNNPDYFDERYQRFIVNRMRDLLPYPEVPIKLHFRARAQGEARKAKSIELTAPGEESGAAPGEAPVETRPARVRTSERQKKADADKARNKPKRRSTAGQKSRFAKRPSRKSTKNKGSRNR
ncbi:MAG: ribosome biogenesis GTPase Der, partial [Phycisphaerae bacterium]